MNKKFAAMLSKELRQLADDTVCKALDEFGDRWTILGGAKFGWMADEDEPVLIMYRMPGEPIDWEVNDDWFARR